MYKVYRRENRYNKTLLKRTYILPVPWLFIISRFQQRRPENLMSRVNATSRQGIKQQGYVLVLYFLYYIHSSQGKSPAPASYSLMTALTWIFIHLFTDVMAKIKLRSNFFLNLG